MLFSIYFMIIFFFQEAYPNCKKDIFTNNLKEDLILFSEEKNENSCLNLFIISTSMNLKDVVLKFQNKSMIIK